jgi:hypothetical protein
MYIILSIDVRYVAQGLYMYLRNKNNSINLFIYDISACATKNTSDQQGGHLRPKILSTPDTQSVLSKNVAKSHNSIHTRCHSLERPPDSDCFYSRRE